MDRAPLRYPDGPGWFWPFWRRSSRGLTSAPSPLQLSLNNKQLTQMLKSSKPAQEEEEDPLAYYENHTSQIEVWPWENDVE